MLTKLIFPFSIIAIAYFSLNIAVGQTNKILHYTETSGYDHQTRSVSFNMFAQIGNQHGIAIDDEDNGNSFNSLINLQQYDAIIFSNTSGNNILDSTQQSNFMQYMNNGGSFIGIHAASDTYRHSTANGSNTGTWDWYAEMLGASVRENPNHVNGQPVYRIDAVNTHTLLTNIPDPWFKSEEYYYWDGGYFNSSNNILQMVEQTVGPNGMVNSYDSARAVTWFRLLNGGGKVFYTALGHDVNNFTSDSSFYNLLENAVLWTTGITSIPQTESEKERFDIFPNPFNEILKISEIEMDGKNDIYLINSLGKIMGKWVMDETSFKMNTHALPAGSYTIKIVTEDSVFCNKIIKL